MAADAACVHGEGPAGIIDNVLNDLRLDQRGGLVELQQCGGAAIAAEQAKVVISPEVVGCAGLFRGPLRVQMGEQRGDLPRQGLVMIAQREDPGPDRHALHQNRRACRRTGDGLDQPRLGPVRQHLLEHGRGMVDTPLCDFLRKLGQGYAVFQAATDIARDLVQFEQGVPGLRNDHRLIADEGHGSPGGKAQHQFRPLRALRPFAI